LDTKESETRLRRGLAAQESAYGQDHPLVAIQLSRLADCILGIDWFSPHGITDEKRINEAESLYQRSLAIVRKTLDKDSLLTKILDQNSNPDTRGRHPTPPPGLTEPAVAFPFGPQPGGMPGQPGSLPLPQGDWIWVPNKPLPVFQPAPGHSLPGQP
jgi:hypothetical protein